MKLACFGWVDADAGSVSSANFVVLRELLARGVTVDLFANREHVREPIGLDDGHFRYIGVQPPVLYRYMAPRYQHVVNWAFDPVVRRKWRRIYDPVVAKCGCQVGGYDAVLSLGTPPAFDIAGVPTITWLQGPPNAELDAIRRLRPEIAATEGQTFCLVLISLYRYRRTVTRGAFVSSDRLICGSVWARDLMVSDGFAAAKVEVLPYPIDLDVFRPAPSRSLDWSEPIILWLGRLDPRKRLDLLVQAFELVLENHPGARLKIIGRPGYGRHSVQPIEASHHADRIEYRAWIPRERVAPTMRSSAVLVQTSENENFGSAVAEALACGVPVVVGPRNGTREYIDDESRVFESYTPASVASAMNEVLARQLTNAGSVSSSARAVAEAMFSPAAVADRLLEIITGAAKGGPRSIGAVRKAANRSRGMAR